MTQSKSHPTPTTVRKRIGVLSPSFARNSVLMRELMDIGEVLIPPAAVHPMIRESIVEFVNAQQLDGLVVGLEPISRELLCDCPSLRLIAKYGVGLDNVDLAAASQLGIQVGWTPGVNKRSVTELVLGFVLGHFRNIVPSLRLMDRGVWEKNGGRLVSELTIGIVGLGNIGYDFAQIAKALGAQVLFHDIADRTMQVNASQLISCSYHELIRRADVVSFHVPFTPDTENYFSNDEIKAAKNDALVINTSRGSIVDFHACVKAVQEKELGGFATDVYPFEPFDTRELAHPHLYFTPHIGGNAAEAVLAMGRAAIGHIRRFYGIEKGVNE